MSKLDNYCLRLGNIEYRPIMIGGMGVDISTPAMVVEGARLGGIAHLSDALICSISDRYFGTTLAKAKFNKYKDFSGEANKLFAQFDLTEVKDSVKRLVEYTINQKSNVGGVFINIMEKLTMNNPRETLRARMWGALDGGIDGLSLSAGLHLGSLDLIEDHPRFRDAKIGIIVSSVRALKLFLKRAARLNRNPDYVVVEGPLAGGHLGFGIDDWASFDLKTIFREVVDFLKKEGLKIPVIPAGGIFTGTEGVEFIKEGAAAVQVATRFTITKESGLPDKVKQEYFKAHEEDIEVNMVSPTGYPMRMLKSSPCIGAGGKPCCEQYGYVLDKDGNCKYIDSYKAEVARNPEKISVKDKTCLCTQMEFYKTWTCGHMAYRLKDTTNLLADGSYQQPTTEDVFNDYLNSQDNQIILPKTE
ncbi:MAG: nitronate monooxygenase [Nitrospinota bacterium]|nr:nitronate monooxygenase [Nitrospinota bacterium]